MAGTATIAWLTYSVSNVTINSFDPQTSNSGTGQTVHSLSGVPTGALLVVTTAADVPDGSDATLSSVPSLSWTKQVDTSAIDSGAAEVWTAIAGSNGTYTVTSTWGAADQSSVCYVVVNQEGTLGGATATDVLQDSPSVPITTTRANSIIFGISADWQAIDGAIRSIRDTATETNYHFVNGVYTGYHYYKQATTAASHTLGYSAPTGQHSGTALLEIRGN